MITNVNNRVIFITGSTRGIGRAVAEAAIKAGYTVILHGRKESEKGLVLAKMLKCDIYYFDVSNKVAVDLAMKRLTQKYPCLSSVVNCAGIVMPQSYNDYATKNWMDHFAVNVLGAVNVVTALRDNIRSGGAVVNVASIRGVHGSASDRVAAYSASKAALLNVTETMAKHYSPFIRANAVSPSFTLTDMSKSWDELAITSTKSNLLQQPATTEEVASAIMFLASDSSSHITGQNLIVDGGFNVRN